MRQPKSTQLQKGPKFLRDSVNDVRSDALTAQPIAGDGIKVDEYEGQGTVVSIDRSKGTVTGNNTISLQVCISGVTKTVTFVIIGSPT